MRYITGEPIAYGLKICWKACHHEMRHTENFYSKKVKGQGHEVITRGHLSVSIQLRNSRMKSGSNLMYSYPVVCVTDILTSRSNFKLIKLNKTYTRHAPKTDQRDGRTLMELQGEPYIVWPSGPNAFLCYTTSIDKRG